jgi:hypothetical protein
MSRSPRRCLIAVSFLLVGMLAGAAAHARDFAPRPYEGVAERLASLPQILLREVRELLVSAWAKNGASLDPFGQPQPNQGGSGSSTGSGSTGSVPTDPES